MDQISIKEIIVHKLFGHFTYRIHPENFQSVCEKLLVFYGDNGSGKTTILKLIFFLLSTKYGSGFKSEISKTKFKKFSIKFTTGLEIGAERQNGQLIGTYSFYIKRNRRIQSRTLFKAKDDLTIDPSQEENIKRNLKAIKELGIRVFYLSDQRKLYNSITSTINEDDSEFEAYQKTLERNQLKKRNIDFQKYSVEAALEKLNLWISEQIIVSSRIGERNTNNIYIEIANNIIKSKKSKENSRQMAIEITKLIDEIAIRSDEFSNLGLVSSLETKEILEALKKAKQDRLSTITAVLKPFVEGIKAKLDALEILKITIQKFLYHVNTFFSKKNISFKLSEGFSIRHEQGDDELKLSYLSSGERQLLLLFANTVTATKEATFFIIDEPEISLNIKWQRMLTNSLLDLSQNSNVQFLLATHSFELLSAKPECVVKLEEKSSAS